ncbi:right-handed parallel beta-helix repeat-containing protein [Klebsiella variicola]|nr:right-handed parallel beta-helix repeat-containing protein [Klebsiella variicola]
MSEYDTGNPVPSASMPDAWDNMQSIDMFANSSDETITTRTGKQLDTLHGINVKSDNQRTEQQDSFELSQSERASSFEEKSNEFESRFSSQLSIQESTFSESQTDKENRFQQFLLSSGYIFLGDYENGPFQFSARNQYIRYDNQYYRLNAATDVGFTTTGTDATSFANDVSHFVLMDGDALRQNLGSSDGASLIGGLGFLTPEMFGAKCDWVSDDSDAVLLAIERASIGPTKIIWVGGGKYLCSPVNFNIPSGVSIIGGGAGSGFIFPTPPSSAMHEFFTLAGNGSLLKDFSIQFNTGGLGSIGAVQAYGVWFKDTATNCRAEGLTIDGKYTDTVMGFSNGFRLTGKDNLVKECIVTHCSMGATVRGERLRIVGGRYDNGYTLEDGGPWNSSKPQWDGIACEGVIDCEISGVTCSNNGQSGVYIGGGGSGFSSGVRIVNCICIHNWNRGIDTGISGTQSTTNDVTNFTISDNHLRDNRETQLWLYGTNNSRISNNSVFETSEYNTLFGTQASATRAGIALGLSSACVNNVIEGNTVIVQSTTPYSVVYNGTGHKISASNRVMGGQTTYIFGNDTMRLNSNNVEFYQGTFTPQLIVGSGLTLSSSTGRYTIKSGRVNFDISLTLAASSPSGPLTIGYIPGVSSASFRDRSFNVDIYNGWNKTLENSILRAIQGESKDQIQVVRLLNGSYKQDASAYAVTGCTIHIHGYVETSPTYSGG